jgi:putative tricarboxylic transport membrane protein
VVNNHRERVTKVGRFRERVKVDLVTGVALLLVGVLYLSHAMTLSLWKETTLGPGLFPVLLGICMVVVSLLMIARATFSTVAGAASAEDSVSTRAGLIRIGFVIGALVGYSFLLDLLGFVISTFLFLAILFVVLDPTKKLSGVLYAGVVVACSYLLLVVLLKTPLPKGLLG